MNLIKINIKIINKFYLIMNKRTVKTKTETKGKTTSTTKTKIQVEPGKRMEETIVIKRKVNPYIDNYSYRETKNIYNKNPRFQVTVEHKRKGDIIGGGNFEETSYQRQVFSQGGNRQKLPEQNQKLRANKSEVKMSKPQNTTTKKTSTRTNKDKNPISSSAKKEKITETTVKRRSEGTKTETKTQSKTTTIGVRGQPTKSSTSTKTTTKTTKIGGGSAPEGGAVVGESSIRRRFGKK